MPLPIRPLSGLVSVVAAGLLLAACSSSTSGGGTVASTGGSSTASSSSPASSPAASTSAATGQNGALPAAALSAAAQKAVISATSFHMRGRGTDGGKPVVFDIHYGKTSSDGYLSLNGARVDLRYVQPTVYLRGGTAFWKLIAASDTSSTAAQKKVLIARLSGKWVKVPSTASGIAELSSIAIRTQFQKQIAKDNSSGPYVKGPAKTVGTTSEVSFVDQSDGSTIYVPANGTPYPLEILSPSDKSSFLLTDWNVPFTAPTPTQVVSLSG